MKEEQVIRVTAAVLRRGDEYLICRRANGLWEFPGGKTEPGETPEACLARECMEELSIRIRVGELLSEVTVPASGGRSLSISFFAAELLEGEPAPSVHTEICYAARETLAGYEFCPADRIFLEQTVFGEGKNR